MGGKTWRRRVEIEKYFLFFNIKRRYETFMFCNTFFSDPVSFNTIAGSGFIKSQISAPCRISGCLSEVREGDDD
jgi:hypothetical protein